MKQRRQLVFLAALLALGAGLLLSSRRAMRVAPFAPGPSVSETFNGLAEAGSIHWDEIEKARAAIYHDSRPVAPAGKSYTPPKDSRDSAVRRVDEEPPKPFAFFGYGTVPVGAPRRAFLTDGTEVFVVAEGQTLMERFRILCIEDGAVEMEDLPTGRRSTLLLDTGLAARSRNST